MGNAFSKDGCFTKFLEKIPVIGHLVAAVHAIIGNTDEAKRAAAVSTNDLITTAGAAGGFIVGGPLGAVAAGALSSSAGNGVEYGISRTIDSPEVKKGVGDVSLKRFLIEGALSGVGGVVGAGGSEQIIAASLKQGAVETAIDFTHTAGRSTATRAVEVKVGMASSHTPRNEILNKRPGVETKAIKVPREIAWLEANEATNLLRNEIAHPTVPTRYAPTQKDLVEDVAGKWTQYLKEIEKDAF